ncbi:MAG: S-layer homology domain-containing protein [Smithella sp.]|jgi:hypothetical protein
MSFECKKKFRKTLIIFIAMTLTIGGLGINSFAVGESDKPAFSSGEGTESSPYLISTRDDLVALSSSMTSGSTDRSASFRLMADIDLAELAWVPIGSMSASFSGVFDGNGKRITVRNIKNGNLLGLFGFADSHSTIKNLTVNSAVKITADTTEDVYFGLVAGRSEGTVINCKTEGSVTLTTNTPKELFFGGLIGKGSGSFSYLQNNTGLTLSRSGQGFTYFGGIAGANSVNKSSLSYVTNTGEITATVGGKVSAGGIVGEYSSGAKIYDALNIGEISITVEKTDGSIQEYTGGIAGTVANTDLDKALNKGKVYVAYTGKSYNLEIIAGGIVGTAMNGKVINVGNEGYVEAKGLIIFSSGIMGKFGSEASIANAYNKGSIYGSSPADRSELYVAGLTDGIGIVENFYNSGTVRLEAGSMGEIDGNAITNIRPGENTTKFNYCYWATGLFPFPFLVKVQPATSSFNTATGKLTKSINIGGKSQSIITGALNAWVSTKQGEYLTWSGTNTPGFNASFGYMVLESMTYRNSREGKWLNASDWAYMWMDKADKLDIIPTVLMNADMTNPITRCEFSALAVELYEILSGKAAIANINSPFSDTEDQYVIKAYVLGIVTGMGNGIFAPNAILTREHAAVMLTRTYKTAFWEGWTLAGDADYATHALDIEGAVKFSDDNLIGFWAKDSVYFMVKSGIINGGGENIFAPSFQAGKKEGYGTATREQAFKMAVAMSETFSGTK